MREIKFRAWNIEQKKMIGSNELHFHEYVSIEDQFKDDEYIFMQYTGLNDKNGKEIYEGDIVSVMVNEITKENIHNDKFYKEGKKYHTGNKIPSIWTIEWVSHVCFTGFRFYGLNRRFNKAATNSVIYNNEVSVIGNIHENPDLLAGVKS